MIVMLRDATYVVDLLQQSSMQRRIETAASVEVVLTLSSWTDYIPADGVDLLRQAKADIAPFFFGLPVRWTVRRDDKLATKQRPLTLRVGFNFVEREAPEAS